MGGPPAADRQRAELLRDHGIYEGSVFREWMADRLAENGITQFGQLRDDDAGDPDQRYRLRVIASDVSHRRLLVPPNDAEHLGVDPDEWRREMRAGLLVAGGPRRFRDQSALSGGLTRV